MKIGTKLTIAFFTIGFAAMFLTGIISYNSAGSALEKESFKKLTVIRELKSNQISNYFTQIKNQLLAMAEDPSIIDAAKGFKKGFNGIIDELHLNTEGLMQRRNKVDDFIDTVFVPELFKKNISIVNKKNIESKTANGLVLQQFFIAENENPVKQKQQLDSIKVKCTYNNYHKKYHLAIKEFIERFGYYDVLIIDNETGNVIYSVLKEIDFASSINDVGYRNTNLSEAFNLAVKLKHKNHVALVDFKEYLPSYNAPTSFMACPIYEQHKIIGVLVFQMPINNINNIITNNNNWEAVGLGKTGESSLIGEDYTLRNQNRLFIEDSATYFKNLIEIGTSKTLLQKIKNYNSTIGLQEIKTQSVKNAFNGQTGHLISYDYLGNKVLTSFKPLIIMGKKWALIEEVAFSEALAPVVVLKNKILLASVFILLFILIVSFIVSKRISKPIKELNTDALELAKGNLSVIINNTHNKDEIGSLAKSFEVMRNALKEFIDDLETKIVERTQEIVTQKNSLEAKQTEIINNLNYAKNIQRALMASDLFLKKYLNEYFILFKPKEIVGSAFYWATKTNTHFYLVVADSAGFGISGAFISLLNMAFLNEAINQYKLNEPNEILNHVHNRLIKNLTNEKLNDGMDIMLLSIAFDSNTVSYSSGNIIPLMVRNNSIIELPFNTEQVGVGNKKANFNLQTVNITLGDVLVCGTNSYFMQLNKNNETLGLTRFKENLLRVKNFNQISSELVNVFNDYRQGAEQVEDVCMVGIKF
ncbi:MAG: SpoIIE family protein phosphatase [Bacteroidetes bacterium]|nr:SpoIIE family protein phosphatase [Bacteroidota bacterium]